MKLSLSGESTMCIQSDNLHFSSGKSMNAINHGGRKSVFG